MARPGGMRGAIESAALAVGMARRVGPKAQKSECQSQSADHKPPSYLPPAHLRIPPGRPKTTVRLILWFCKNNSQCRAGSKKLIRDRNWYEYASKMQASNCFFYAFHVSTHFLHHIFWKLLFLPRRGAHVYKNSKKLKKNHANKHQKSNFLKQVTEIAKMNCKLCLPRPLVICKF